MDYRPATNPPTPEFAGFKWRFFKLHQRLLERNIAEQCSFIAAEKYEFSRYAQTADERREFGKQVQSWMSYVQSDERKLDVLHFSMQDLLSYFKGKNTPGWVLPKEYLERHVPDPLHYAYQVLGELFDSDSTDEISLSDESNDSGFDDSNFSSEASEASTHSENYAHNELPATIIEDLPLNEAQILANWTTICDMSHDLQTYINEHNSVLNKDLKLDWQTLANTMQFLDPNSKNNADEEEEEEGSISRTDIPSAAAAAAAAATAQETEIRQRRLAKHLENQYIYSGSEDSDLENLSESDGSLGERERGDVERLDVPPRKSAINHDVDERDGFVHKVDCKCVRCEGIA